jgi:hypothetical protein
MGCQITVALATFRAIRPAGGRQTAHRPPTAPQDRVRPTGSTAPTAAIRAHGRKTGNGPEPLWITPSRGRQRGQKTASYPQVVLPRLPGPGPMRLQTGMRVIDSIRITHSDLAEFYETSRSGRPIDGLAGGEEVSKDGRRRILIATNPDHTRSCAGAPRQSIGRGPCETSRKGGEQRWAADSNCDQS